jgi:hypothetical protein
MDAATPNGPKPKSAIEIAREFGVDIEGLRAMLKRTPTERLLLMQSLAQLMLDSRAALRKRGIVINNDPNFRISRAQKPETDA